MRRHISINSNAEVHESVVFGPNCVNISIGHASRIRAGVYIDVENLSIGDYVTVNPGTVIHGEKVQIGHNCWIGQYSILDGHGGLLSIGNNVGVGAHSQLWSHMKFGDRLDGCRWHRMSELKIEDDVWFVGHCLVTPIVARARSMLMLGGMVTHDMEENQIYAGSPAKNVTETFGRQFEPVSIDQRIAVFSAYLSEYRELGHEIDSFRVLGEAENPSSADVTYFDLAARQYYPTYSRIETEFIRYLLYDRAKFLPVAKSSSDLRIPS